MLLKLSNRNSVKFTVFTMKERKLPSSKKETIIFVGKKAPEGDVIVFFSDQ